MDIFVICCSAVMGMIIGSFLNVCIYRMPREKSIVWPPSGCPHCGAPIKPYDNIPVLSFLLLGGKCRACKGPISCRYPIIEALTGALTVLYTWHYLSHPVWLAAALPAVYALLVLSVIDIDFMIIPDELSLGLLGLGLLASPFNPHLGGMWTERVVSSLIGAVTGFGVLWGLAVGGELVFKKEAMGGGDIKLMAGVGAFCGWQGMLAALLIGSFLGSIYGVLLMVSNRLGRSQPIPFGPFLALGAAVNIYSPIPLLAILLR